MNILRNSLAWLTIAVSLTGMAGFSAHAEEGTDGTASYSYDQMYEDLCYEVTDANEIRITHCMQSAQTCDIPAEIDGMPVTEIADNAFAECYFLTKLTMADTIQTIGKQAFSACSKLETVTLPASLTELGAGVFDQCSVLTSVNLNGALSEIPQAAFYECTALKTVQLPEQLQTIGKEAFHGCTALETLTLPDSLETISDYAFEGCSALTEVTLPESLDTLGNYVFESCSALERITVSENNAAYCDAEGILFSKDCTRLIKFPDACPISNYTVPETCTTLEPWCFINAANLKHIDLGTVSTIGEQAFFFCTSLEEITIPEGVTKLDNSTFAYCSALKQISLPSTLQTIGNYCFYACGSLSAVNIPEQVTAIGNYALHNCVSLQSLTLPDTIESLGDGAFGYYVPTDDEGNELEPQKIENLTVDYHRNPVIYEYVQRYGLHGTGAAGFPWWIVWASCTVVLAAICITLLVIHHKRAAIPKPVPGGRVGSQTKRPDSSKQKG